MRWLPAESSARRYGLGRSFERSRRATPPSAAPPPSGAISAGVISGHRQRRVNTRALLGGLLVGAAGVVVFASVLAGGPGKSRDYVVATRSLPAGSVIEPSEISTVPVALPSAVASQAFTASGSIVGQTLASAVNPGELIESSMLDRSPPIRRPVSIAVNPDSLLGLVPGEIVDVLSAQPVSSTASSQSTGTPQPAASSQPPSPSTVVMRGALLISIGRSSSGLAGSSSGLTDVTLGVSDLSEVELLVEASQRYTVELVQAEPSDGVGPGASG